MAQRGSKTVQLSVNYTPREWQQLVHDGMATKQKAVLICSRQIGKTRASIAELVHRALTSPPDTCSAYIAPYVSQARKIAWPALKLHLGDVLQHCVVRESELSITLPGNRVIYLLGGDNEAARGLSIRNLLIDEVDNLSQAIVKEVLLPTLSSHGDAAWLCYIGTLSGGQSKLWQLYLEHREDPDWFTLVMPADKSGVYSTGWLNEQRKAVGATAFAREYQCDPSAPVEHAVVGELLHACETEGRILAVRPRPDSGLITS